MTYQAKADMELREGWFDPADYQASLALGLSTAPARAPVRTGRTALGGAVVGALVSAPILGATSWLAGRMEQAPDPIAAGSALGVPFASFFAAGALGAILGAVLGLFMVHSARLRARLIFAPVFSMALYLLAHVLLVVRHAPTLPLIPMLGAAFAFGLCLACAPPFARRRPS